MLDLITASAAPISVKIDGQVKEFALFTMRDWGKLLDRCRDNDIKKLSKSIEETKIEDAVVMQLIKDQNNKIYDVRDGLRYAYTPNGVIDVLHIASKEVDRAKFETLQAKADIDQITYLVNLILCIATEEPDDDADKTEKKKLTKPSGQPTSQ